MRAAKLGGCSNSTWPGGGPMTGSRAEPSAVPQPLVGEGTSRGGGAPRPLMEERGAKRANEE